MYYQLRFQLGSVLIFVKQNLLPEPHAVPTASCPAASVAPGFSSVTQLQVPPPCQPATPGRPPLKAYNLVFAIIYCLTKKLQIFSYCFKPCEV